MIKQQRAEIKQFEKEMQNIIKKQAKQQGYNVISNCIYKKIDRYFAYSVFWVQRIENQYKLFFRMNIKSYDYDDLFWNVFNMKDNINSKDSLRANGAYACPAIQWMEKSYEVERAESSKEVVLNAILDFQNEIETFILNINEIYCDFDSYILKQSDISDEKLMKMLANISKGNYIVARDTAVNEIQNGNRGGYRNEGKDIYEYIVKYCEGQLID